MNPVCQQTNVEVDEQSQVQLRLPQVVAKLRSVHPVNPINGLHFDDDGVLNEKVQPKAAPEPDTLVVERQSFCFSNERPRCDSSNARHASQADSSIPGPSSR